MVIIFNYLLSFCMISHVSPARQAEGEFSHPVTLLFFRKKAPGGRPAALAGIPAAGLLEL